MSITVADLPYPLPPEIMGEIETVSVERHRHVDSLRVRRPEPPGHEVWAYDEGDDVPYYVRDCTPQEIEEREAAYEKSLVEWNRTGGIYQVAGSTVDTCRVRMSDGRFFDLRGDTNEWFIIASGWARFSAAAG